MNHELRIRDFPSQPFYLPAPLFLLELPCPYRPRFAGWAPFPRDPFRLLDPFGKPLQGILEVPVLGAVPAADDHDACRKMLEADGRVGDVPVLPSRPACPEGCDAALLFKSVKIHWFRDAEPRT